MIEDAELLRRYAEEKSEDAFVELVRRHIDLVYAVALRKVGGDVHAAEDVTQRVFGDVARKARELSRHPVLSGWLFTSAHYAATQLVRAEQRRRIREEKAQAMNQLHENEMAAVDWEKLRPLVDDLLCELGERDREAVLLRFFENRTLREIGARLKLSEDGARSRVDRAVEKLRALLARRGMTSTTATLSVAFANQVSIAAPAGLAASVTTSALAGVSAGAGTAAAGGGIFALMSTTKIIGWGIAATVLLASLTANAVLWRQASPSSSVSPPGNRSAVKPAEATSATASDALARLDQADLATVRDQLRAANTDEASIRAVLEGVLRQHYRARLSADRAERARRGWWRDPGFGRNSPEYPMQMPDDPRLLRELVTLPLERLLGPDPLAVAEAEARYAYLPPELREAFGRLDRALPASAVLTGVLEVDAVISAEYAAQRSSLEQERKALIDSLTPAQRLDWEMHNSQLATTLSRQLGPIDATEEEYRKVFPLADNYAKSRNSRATGETTDQQMMDQLVTALGYDRALDYIWSGAVEYAPYARVARDANLPPSTAARVMELAAETAHQASAIHGDGTLDVAAKRTALAALQQRVRPTLDALVPPAVQQRLTPNAQTWLSGLSEGTYKPIRGSLPGSSGMVVMSAQYVDRPPPASLATLQPLPTRPGAK